MPLAGEIAVRGVARVKKLVGASDADKLMPLFARLLRSRPGHRLPLGEPGKSLDAVHGKVRCVIGDEARPERALLFDSFMHRSAPAQVGVDACCKWPMRHSTCRVGWNGPLERRGGVA